MMARAAAWIWRSFLLDMRPPHMEGTPVAVQPVAPWGEP
jgi:hypothetical protein